MFDGTCLACATFLPCGAYEPSLLLLSNASNILQQSISHIDTRDADIRLHHPNTQDSLRSHFEPVDHDVHLPHEDYKHQTLVR
jgi:hypothetical protein